MVKLHCNMVKLHCNVISLQKKASLHKLEGRDQEGFGKKWQFKFYFFLQVWKQQILEYFHVFVFWQLFLKLDTRSVRQRLLRMRLADAPWSWQILRHILMHVISHCGGFDGAVRAHPVVCYQKFFVQFFSFF